MQGKFDEELGLHFVALAVSARGFERKLDQMTGFILGQKEELRIGFFTKRNDKADYVLFGFSDAGHAKEFARTFRGEVLAALPDCEAHIFI